MSMPHKFPQDLHKIPDAFAECHVYLGKFEKCIAQLNKSNLEEMKAVLLESLKLYGQGHLALELLCLSALSFYAQQEREVGHA